MQVNAIYRQRAIDRFFHCIFVKILTLSLLSFTDNIKKIFVSRSKLGAFGLQSENKTHILDPYVTPKRSWLKFIWETVKPMGIQKIQNLTRSSGLKSAAPKVPQIRFSFYQNAVVSSISGQRWCKKTCLLIGGVHFLENMHFLCFGR